MHTMPRSQIGWRTRNRVVSHADRFLSDPRHVGQPLEDRRQSLAERTEEGEQDAHRAHLTLFSHDTAVRHWRPPAGDTQAPPGTHRDGVEPDVTVKHTERARWWARV